MSKRGSNDFSKSQTVSFDVCASVLPDRFPFLGPFLMTLPTLCRIHETMLESEPLSQLANPTRNADVDDPIKEDNLSYNSAASSSWSLAGKMQLEEKQEVQEDLELKVWPFYSIETLSCLGLMSQSQTE